MKIRNIIIIALVLLLGFALGIIYNLSGSINNKVKVSDEAGIKRDSTSLSAIQNSSDGINERPEVKYYDNQEDLTIDLFENIAPSVTFITTTAIKTDYWSRNVMEIPGGTGSGFIWDKLGHIVTNFHVIEDATKAQVTLADNTSWPATLVGIAKEKDLAVLKIEAPEESLTPIPVGRSFDLKVGQGVFAIGNPFGLDQTLTTGIISALGREIQSRAQIPIRDVIQTDAAINPGNSGGPLLDSSGKLIGVNTAIYSPSGTYAGIGFSIPVDVVNWVVPDLIKYGKVIRPRLGIEMAGSQYTERIGLNGVLILNIIPGSPAENAGLHATEINKQGDLIIGINNLKIKNNLDLILGLEKYKSGDRIKLLIIRNNKESEVYVTLDSQ